MNYICLIYTDPTIELSDEANAEMMQAYFAFTTELQASGAMVAGEPLQGTETATTVRVRNGETVMTDGPFAETKEILGGFYILDVDNLDEAVAWAAKIPASAFGSVEVRPLMELPEA